MADGVYAQVVAWRSSASWLATVYRQLTSRRGLSALKRARITRDTVLLVARADARSADFRTGRGVSTSHATVAARLGMSKRTVGTARRLLESLGLAVTVALGRHLSPAERSQAHAAHGGYQQAAASVRALTVPAGIPVPVENFHLPRSGYVLEESHLSENSPTRARGRARAASRQKPSKKKGNQPHRPPRPVEIQRFAWDIARHFGLTTPELATPARDPRDLAQPAGGTLHGHRHIGHLCRLLEQHRVTPERYTLDTLRREIDDMLRERRITPPPNDAKRDRIAHFAWTLAQLASHRSGPTLLEQRKQDDQLRRQQRAERQRQLAAETAARADTIRRTETAARAALAQMRRRPHTSDRLTRAEHETIITTVLGTPTALLTATTAQQTLVGALTNLHRALRTTHTLTARCRQLIWLDTNDAPALALDLDSAEITLTTTGNLPQHTREHLDFVIHELRNYRTL